MIRLEVEKDAVKGAIHAEEDSVVEDADLDEKNAEENAEQDENEECAVAHGVLLLARVHQVKTVTMKSPSLILVDQSLRPSRRTARPREPPRAPGGAVGAHAPTTVCVLVVVVVVVRSMQQRVRGSSSSSSVTMTISGSLAVARAGCTGNTEYVENADTQNKLLEKRERGSNILRAIVLLIL